MAVMKTLAPVWLLNSFTRSLAIGTMFAWSDIVLSASAPNRNNLFRMPRLYRRAFGEPIDRKDHLVIVSKEIERAITFLLEISQPEPPCVSMRFFGRWTGPHANAWRFRGPMRAASAFGPG